MLKFEENQHRQLLMLHLFSSMTKLDRLLHQDTFLILLTVGLKLLFVEDYQVRTIL